MIKIASPPERLENFEKNRAPVRSVPKIKKKIALPCGASSSVFKIWMKTFISGGGEAENPKTRSLIEPDDIYDKPMTFDARRFHQVEPHEGHMWALAAYVPQAFTWISNENAEKLSSLNFPLPE